MTIETIGFIGLGLIGGSLAKMIRRVYPDRKIIGYNRSKASLAAALEDGTLSQAVSTIDETFAECDIIFLCAPVEVNIRCMKELSSIIRKDCILTDVGSVKTPIHEAVAELGMDDQFIGGHPMAGSERFGYAAASDRLLENAYYILTPSARSTGEMLAEYQALVSGIGSLPIVMDYREHDRATAAISHLPHVIAYALVNLVKDSDSEEGTMRQLAAGGFRDITRIASSSPDMWQQICAENKTALVDLLQQYRHRLEEMETAIREGDDQFLWQHFEDARAYRNLMPQSHAKSGDGELFTLSVDLEDEPGAIAVALSILSAGRVNVNNVGIMHNREHQYGVLRLVVPTREAQIQACELLTRRNYKVYVD